MMKRLIFCLVICLTAVVCFSAAEDGSLLREVRKTKHSDKHKETSAVETPAVDTPAVDTPDYLNDGYTIVTIPKTATKPTLVDSLMSMINNASQARNAQPEVRSVPQAENVDTTSSPPVETTTVISTTPTPTITEANATGDPEAVHVEEVSSPLYNTEEGNSTGVPEARNVEGVSSPPSNTEQLNPTGVPEAVHVEEVSSPPSNTEELNPPTGVEANNSVGKSSPSSTDYDTGELIPLVDKINTFSLELNNTLDSPALVKVCEESKRQLVQMFNKVVGQLCELFNAMYAKMTAIASQKNSTSTT